VGNGLRHKEQFVYGKNQRLTLIADYVLIFALRLFLSGWYIKKAMGLA